jgi:hypothetical protein
VGPPVDCRLSGIPFKFQFDDTTGYQ